MIGMRVVIYSDYWPQWTGEFGEIVFAGPMTIWRGGMQYDVPGARVRMARVPEIVCDWMLSDLRNASGLDAGILEPSAPGATLDAEPGPEHPPSG